MKSPIIYMGSAPVATSSAKVGGSYVRRGSERFYCITNYDRMQPFFMSVVSDSDHWMFISSTGGLSAGRQSAKNALFPYYSEDKIHDNAGNTGSRTVILLQKDKKTFLWEPFSNSSARPYAVTRNIYKNFYGNKLMFEEINSDLELVFRYTWMPSERYGFVKHSQLENRSGAPLTVDVLDGVENILPWGVVEYFQNYFSCLGDAYKQNELESATGLGTFAFSSIPGDSTEPAEALRATICWSSCPPEVPRLLSSVQLETFRAGGEIQPEVKVCGRRGAYFIHDRRQLASGEEQDWHIIADVDCGHTEISSVQQTLRESFATGNSALRRLVDEDTGRGTQGLAKIVARSDGLQKTGDTLGSAHHFSNVLFNVMRGGIFESAYRIPVGDLRGFIRSFNHEVYSRQEPLLNQLGEAVELDSLVERARSSADPDLLRLVHEYLPLSFSRRHGDPSRPWNKFSIDVKNRDGSRILNYQGNWRDIFQNWEALCISFPEYLESIIFKFLNTTTADGYNPYRVTKDGYEWEAPNPDEPWANYGYWGDHQLIYLLKFLEMSERYHPGKLSSFLARRIFVYADVPYDIKPYRELLTDPRKSIAYNTRREQKIAARESSLGRDGKYMVEKAGNVCRANMAEKLLVPVLAKMSNFIPGAGFWMNTQRPEWNDANNALAGYGVSMVTVYYARRFLSFCLDFFENAGIEEVQLNSEVASWFQAIAECLKRNGGMLKKDAVNDADRRALLDGLGEAADQYRSGVYERDFSGQTTPVPIEDLAAFCKLALEYIDQTIRLSRRDDGLYHAYNVMGVAPRGISLTHLVEMLEGQVAVLSSGCLGSEQALAVLKALNNSPMYRRDQHSYMLYPDKVLPDFLEKNLIPPEEAEKSELFAKLAADANTDLVERDVEGSWHFNSLFKNIRDVEAALELLPDKGYRQLVEKETKLVSEIFESVFNHKEFTGRSRTFYGYEGLGCIYWHMVSKLLLAVQESCLAAHAANDGLFGELAECYYDVRAGIGFNKTPEEYGAFPTDPYSHTPGYAGARQPGMTGQVKEEIITRFGELGLFVRRGEMHFVPALLRRREFLSGAETFDYYDVAGDLRSLELEKGTLAFTCCQVPVVYHDSEDEELLVRFSGGTEREVVGRVLDHDLSREIFKRTGRIAQLSVFLRPGLDS